MSVLGKYIISLFLLLLIFTMFVGCSIKSNSNDTFGIEQFQNEMKAKNYNFAIKDVEKDFLPTTRKRMIIGNEALDIYIYSSNQKMEKDAKLIDSDGGGYHNGTKSIKVDWVSPPNFYKRGKIIVQYTGGNEKIINDLKNILGKQFTVSK